MSNVNLFSLNSGKYRDWFMIFIVKKVNLILKNKSYLILKEKINDIG